jgi:AAHS family 4-hydroxybenzoate transporter-like MFS transporter
MQTPHGIATAAPDHPQAVNVTELIDHRPITSLQMLVFVLCSLAALLDGADSQSIGVAAPLIAAGFGMPMGSFAPAFSVGLLGATIGALTFGGLGDRFGRKRTLLVAMLLMSVFTLLTAVASSFPQLLVVRFLGGLGLGGATPCFITLAAEYAPKRRRAMLASILWAAYPLGASAGGLLNATVIPELGWRAVFYIGGGLPLIVAALMVFFLPESLSYLVARGDASPRARAIVGRLDKTLANRPLRLFATTETTTGSVGLKQLFTEGRAISTLLLWAMLFTAFGTTTVIVLLSPTLFRASGLSLSTAALLVGLNNFVGVAGMASAGRLVERFGPLALLPAFLFGGALLAILGFVASSFVLSAICMALLGLTALLGASGGVALAATSYPTAIRSTGVGWGMGMARFGQVCSPLIVGLMLRLDWGVPRILGVMALLPVLAGVLCVIRTLHQRHTIGIVSETA